jgi:D-amino peptidase
VRVYVSVDMEGVAGVVHADQTRRGRGGYAEAAELMTLEANAAAQGAFDAGAEVVLVNDSHGDMRNLLLDRLDSRVQVITGNLKPFSMAEGLDGGAFDVALFVGYHGGAGTQAAILDHTYRGNVVAQVRLGGRAMNEAALNALVAGAAGTPVGLVTGDESTCAQCRSLLGDIETVSVKWAMGRLAARSLHPEVARQRIREAATRVLQTHERFRPYRVDPPLVLEIDMISTAMVDAASLMPGTERPAPRTVRYVADDVQTMFRAMLALIRLGGIGIA